jgi:predicted dehydrogenase
MVKPIRMAVIGVGRMGMHHCRVYSNLRQVKFVGVFDVNPHAAERAAFTHEVPVFQDLEALIDQVDAVSITTPTAFHYNLAMRCLGAGLHVLVEKPIAETLEQAEAMARAAEQSGRVLLVGHIERFNPAYLELKNVLEGKEILAANFRRLSPFQGSNTDVDVALDLMIHDADLAVDLLSEPSGPAPVLRGSAGIKVFNDNLDYILAQLSFPSCPIVTLTASRATEQKIRAIDVTTRTAYLEADLLNKSILVHRRSFGEYLNQNHSSVKYRQESIVERIVVPTVEPLLSEIQHFLHCIADGIEPRVSARMGLETLRLTYEIRDAAVQPQRLMGLAVPA